MSEGRNLAIAASLISGLARAGIAMHMLSLRSWTMRMAGTSINESNAHGKPAKASPRKGS